MPLSSRSPTILHILQNISLISLSALFAPLCTYIAIISRIISPFTAFAKHINQRRKWRASSSDTSRPSTILVTGVGMSKGLFLARTFYRAGHRVVGADFEPYGVPVCGRFSVALDKFYKLSQPSPKMAADGSRKYVDGLVEIVKKEKVDLWVSCSGVASALEDGEAAEAVERLTKCKAIQFGAILTKILHEKHSFIENTQNLGLNVPETHLVTSLVDAMEILYPTSPAKSKIPKKYIMKSVGIDDIIRADMTLLPLSSPAATYNHLLALNPRPSHPFVIQQYISGPEYCTHALIIKGQVRAFTACPSSSLLMHYRALPPTSPLAEAMLTYTQLYAQKTGPSMTGHFSLDFLFDRDNYWPGKDLLKTIYPIECNPRAHTAVVCFSATESEALAEAYLSVLADHSHAPALPTSPLQPEDIITPSSSASTSSTSSTPTGTYWIAHDVVTLALQPFWALALQQIDVATFHASWLQFVQHLLYWHEGTFEVWDPWPAWWLYCAYWPAMFGVVLLVTRGWWGSCNVSTGKMFRC